MQQPLGCAINYMHISKEKDSQPAVAARSCCAATTPRYTHGSGARCQFSFTGQHFGLAYKMPSLLSIKLLALIVDSIILLTAHRISPLVHCRAPTCTSNCLDLHAFNQIYQLLDVVLYNTLNYSLSFTTK